MSEPLAPLDREPVSVHVPFLSRPSGDYRYEPFEERRAALLTALEEVALGADDEHLVHWLAMWDVTVVAGLISLPHRARHRAAQQTHRQGSERR